MTVKAEDIRRLDVEMVYEDTDIWMRDNKVDFSVIELVASNGMDAAFDKVAKGANPSQAMAESIANAFVLGWEAFRQYGPRKGRIL